MFAVPNQQAGSQIPGYNTIHRDETSDRITCLDFAIRAMPNGDPGSITKAAGDFYDFATGKTVADRVTAALKNADVG